MRPEDIELTDDERRFADDRIKYIEERMGKKESGDLRGKYWDCVETWPVRALYAVEKYFKGEGYVVRVGENEDHSSISPLRTKEPHRSIYINDPRLPPPAAMPTLPPGK